MAKALSRTVSIYIDGKQVDSTIKSLSAKLQELKNRQRTLTIGTEEYIQTSLKIREINNVLRENNRALQQTNTTIESSLTKLSNIGNILSGAQNLFAMGDAAVGSLKDIVQAATELDDVYADVMKTTGLTHEQVQRLNEAFQKLDTRTSREQLNQLAYEAGKLGISAQADVEQFVKAADKINIALGDVLGEGAMVTIGKLTQVYERSTDIIQQKDLEGRMLAIGSAINSLGQASTANESYMVDFMSRLGGVAAQAGLSADEVLGYASAFDQANLAVEMSATAFQKLIQQMIAKPQEFVNSARMPLKEFQHLMAVDMNGAIQRVLQGMDEMGGFQQLLPIFKDMGLDGARAASAVSSLAGSLSQVTAAQQLANEQLSSGASIEAEFSTKNSSLQAEADKAKKSFEDMRVELGQQLYPVVIHLTRASTASLKTLSGYLNLWKENKAAAAALTAGLATLVLWYSREYAAKVKLKVVDFARTTQQKMQVLQTNLMAAAEARHTLQLEKSRLATLNQQLAVQKKIIADRAEYTAMGANNVVLAAERNARALSSQITTQQIAVTNAHTAATNANKAAMAATPWGAVLAAATALAVGIAKLVKQQRKFRDETKELNKQIGSEASQATYLFDKLKTLDQKTSEYKDTLQKLKDIYPDILQQYTDEEGHLRDLATARQAVIDKIREQITEQRKLDKYGEVAGNFESSKNDALARMHDYLVKHNGKKGEQQYQALLNALPSNFSKEASAEAIYGTVLDNTGIDLKALFGWNKMKNAVGDYINAINEAYKEQQKWKSVFGDVTDGNKNTTTTTTTTTTTVDAPTTSNGIPVSPEVDKEAEKAAKKAAEEAAKELLRNGEKNAEEAQKLLSALASKYTVATVQSDLDLLNNQIDSIAHELEKSFATTGKDGQLHWTNEEMKQLHDNLLNNQTELQKGVINDWLMKLGDDTTDLQQRLNDLGMVDISRVAEIDPEAAQDLRDLIEYFQQLKDNADKAASAIKGVQEATDSDSWQKTLADISSQIDYFSNSALKMWSSINSIIANTENEQLKQLNKTTEAEQKGLEMALENGLITQEDYNTRKEKLDKEYQAKQEELADKQFERNRAYSIAEATIAGALAVMRVLADKTLEGPLRWAQVAAVGVETIAQIAAIASEPKPYALGGYTSQPTILVGERGQEWVASNRLLRDPNTAPIISELEAYQRGRIGMAAVNMQGVGEVAATRSAETQQLQLLNSQFAVLAKYLSDPKNRQAVISRKVQEQFDNNENFLRSAARI